MSELTDAIAVAQREAAERVVIDHVRNKAGFTLKDLPELTIPELEQIEFSAHEVEWLNAYATQKQMSLSGVVLYAVRMLSLIEGTPGAAETLARLASEHLRKAGEVTPVHELKTWPPFFEALVNGRKTFEIRHNDRGYGVGDTLVLKEFDPELGVYSGREVRRLVTYITSMHQNYGFVVMGLR